VFYTTPTADAINTFCSFLFIGEALVKMFTYTFFGYWSDPLNAFDGVLVVLILFEIAITSGSDSMSGNLRAARLFRFFRALRSLRILKLYRMLHVEKKDASTQTESGDADRRSYKRMAAHDVQDEEGNSLPISGRDAGAKVTPVFGDSSTGEEGQVDNGARRSSRSTARGIEILDHTPTEDELAEKEDETTDAEEVKEEEEEDDGPIDLMDMGGE